ncbi:MAG: DUF2236 domain-containing protein, partial [Polyangiaceae bacterium]|nr:DUF2236 domain-containing protein [Polyangiaceae bacterium]
MKQRVIDPAVGLYGPGSMVWEVSRHTTVFFGAGRANLLQLAHPWVTHAIDQHSATQTDPLGRLRRTFINVFSMVYGSLDQVLDSSLRVYQIHDGIRGKISESTGAFSKGSGYIANHVGSMIWVHATLWESALKMYELFERPLSREEKERYYEETKLFAFLFGIPESMLPPNWHEFLEYNEKMWSSDQLKVGEVGRQLADYIFNMSFVLKPVLHRHRLHTAMLLPDRLREEFQLPEKNEKNMRAFERDVAVVKRLMPLMPRRIRYVPTYLEALGRLEGRKEPDLLT